MKKQVEYCNASKVPSRKTGLAICLMMAVLVIAFVATGCSAGKLAESFDAAAVEAKAKTVIETLNKGDYTAVVGMLRQDLQDDLPEDKIKAAVDQVYGNAGTFESFDKVILAGQKAEGKDIAVAVIQAKYQEKKVTFTLSFDQDLNLIGLFMK